MAKTKTITDINVYRNQRRKVKNVRWVMIPVFLVACLFAGYFLSMSNFFAVDKIIILGNSKVADADIIALSGVELGMNIFAVDEKRLAECLPILPRIKSAEMSRRLPGTIKIVVTERQPAALISTGRAVVEIDGEGRILDRFTTVSGEAMPLISGTDIVGQGLIPGCFLTGECINEALEILAALPDDADLIGEIDVTNPQFIKLYTVSGIEVRLGDCANFAEKYLLFSTILRENEDEGGAAIAYIDVSIEAKPAIAYE